MTKSRHIRKILKPSKEVLSSMISAGLTPYQIADQLGYGSGGWSNIYKYCRDYGIDFDFQRNYQLKQVSFSQDQLDVMYGSVLGDAYLRSTNGSKGTSYSLVFSHGEKQIEYLRWKLSIYDQFVTTKKFTVAYRDFHGNAPVSSFSTISHPDITAFYHLSHPDGRKLVTNDWLELLSPLSLAVWYLDDGSLNKRYGTIVMSTNAYSLPELGLMIDWFEKKHGLHAKLEKRRNEQYALRINASESKAFRSIIADYVPECMSYKLG